MHEFDFSVQKDFGRGTVFQISYMGALGRELPNALDINFNPNANTVTTAGGSPNGVVQSVITVSDSTGKGPLPTAQPTPFPPTPASSIPTSEP